MPLRSLQLILLERIRQQSPVTQGKLQVRLLCCLLCSDYYYGCTLRHPGFTGYRGAQNGQDIVRAEVPAQIALLRALGSLNDCDPLPADCYLLNYWTGERPLIRRNLGRTLCPTELQMPIKAESLVNLARIPIG